MSRLAWLLAIAGVVAAVALGVAANEISGDSIGLSAKPMGPGDSLAPASARSERSTEEDTARKRRDRKQSKRTEGRSPQPATRPDAGSSPEPTPEPDGRGSTRRSSDDDGGGENSSGRGRSGEGSGSDEGGSSGSGSDESDSGSEDRGSGSDGSESEDSDDEPKEDD